MVLWGEIIAAPAQAMPLIIVAALTGNTS